MCITHTMYVHMVTQTYLRYTRSPMIRFGLFSTSPGTYRTTPKRMAYCLNRVSQVLKMLVVAL